MATNRLTGIFGTREAAERARDALLGEGIARERIAISVPETGDGIAAEAPGQSYENQPGEGEEAARRGRFGSAVRSAVCALTVDGASSEAERGRIGAILARSGARDVMRPPA
jgi:hypothetical protein